MKTLSRNFFFGSLIILLVSGAFISASPALAEKASLVGDDALAGEVLVDPVLVSAETVPDVASGKVEAAISDSGEVLLRSTDLRDNVTALQSFIDSVSTGSRTVTGIFVHQNFTLQVGQQPSGNAGFITGKGGEVTQFRLASGYGSRGFLAHNYLSGASFFNLEVGTAFTLVYGDGSSEKFVVREIRRFEALQPNSPTSRFVDLDQGGEVSASTLFHSIYNYDNPVVLQTCIENHGVSTWGRLFIIAVPLPS